MLVYLAGPYSAYDGRTVEDHIAAARKVAIECWQAGLATICPHLNTANFDDHVNLSWDTYLEGDLQIVQRVDALVLLPHWRDSRGARREVDYATSLGIPVHEYPDIPKPSATEGKRPHQSRAFLNLVMQMYRIHLAKNADYSPANILATGQIGLVTRLWDKVARLMNLTGFKIEIASATFENPSAPKNESIDDTLLDAAVYAVIGLLLRKGLWGI